LIMHHLRLLVILFGFVVLISAAEFDFRASSYLGGATSSEAVRSVAIQSNGTIVLVANLPDYQVPGAQETLLAAATASSQGMVIRLAPDGQSVLSVTRLADQLLDVVCDDADNLYIATWGDGFFKLDPGAGSVLWHQQLSNVRRCDVTDDGTSVALVTNELDPDSETPTSNIHLFAADGSPQRIISGHRSTLDVAIDAASRTVCFLGWRQASTWDGKKTNPVQISYIRGCGYDGSVKWTAYDWSSDKDSPDWINAPTNNMADTRGICIDVGRDGKLYAAFEVAGGNHIFRYDPFDINKSVKIVKGDMWHDWYNTGSEHKTFFARYEPSTGAYLTGQQFCARKNSDKGNSLKPYQITADADGRVYLVGSAAAHLPIPDRYTPKAGEVAVNPVPFSAIPDYEGGAFMLVMSKDLTTRLYCTRTALGISYGVDARRLADGATRFAWGGTASIKGTNIHYTHEAIQAQAGGGDSDAFFTVIAPELSAAVAPLIDPASGDYVGSVQVQMSSAPADATIRYTTDGSEPSSNSTRYSGPITLNQTGTVTLKARSFASGLAASPVTQRQYHITSDTQPPVLLSAEAVASESIQLVFDEVLDEDSAENSAHYRLQPSVDIVSAELQADGSSVRLRTKALTSGVNYQLTVEGVRDSSLAGNVMAATTRTVRFVDYSIQINFQPAGVDVPSGYLADTGAAFGNRGNGLQYGWNSDNSDNARDRNGISDQRLDTFNHMQFKGDFVWEIALPNGSYYLNLAAFDPSYTEAHAIAAEGSIVLEGDTASGAGPVEVTDVLVQVADGRLTLTSPKGSETHNKINFIRIAAATPPEPISRTVRIQAQRGQEALPLQVAVDQTEASIVYDQETAVISDVDGRQDLLISCQAAGNG
ncbi:MAG: chitobiase/beta-hexosaminidase C-terminal domain-containing protein, partial [Planctomycetota bacterium]